MQFDSFFDEFPEKVMSEFRNIFIPEDHPIIPAGNYAFSEYYCSEIDCDCRKTIIKVMTAEPFKVWATINYGWESADFYKKWFGTSDDFYKTMVGVQLEYPISDPAAIELTKTFSEIIEADIVYQERIKSHYQQFKKRILEKQQSKIPYKSNGRKVGRNEPCLCGSGKKFKQCCLH